MIPAATPSLPPSARLFLKGPGAQVAVVTAPIFASLLGGDEAATAVDEAPAGKAPASDRQDDAVAGNAPPAGADLSSIDADWLSAMLAGTLPVAADAAAPLVATADRSRSPAIHPLQTAGLPGAVAQVRLSTRVAVDSTPLPDGKGQVVDATTRNPADDASVPAPAPTIDPAIPVLAARQVRAGTVSRPTVDVAAVAPAAPIARVDPGALTGGAAFLPSRPLSPPAMTIAITRADGAADPLAGPAVPVPTATSAPPTRAAPSRSATPGVAQPPTTSSDAAWQQPGSTPPAPNPIAPAGEAFAAAIHAAARPEDDGARPDDPIAAPAFAGTAPIPPGTVPAAADRGGAQLDMRQDTWPAAMIDHIGRLRDAADATDTRIRLVPDALGGIDVSLRRHDDGVSVTLAADQPATQAMIAEARPQLTDLAQARGIRLTDAAPAGGTGAQGFGHGQGQRPPPPGLVPSAPASASTAPASTAVHDEPADSRVA